MALDVLAADHAIVYCDQLTVHHYPSPAGNSALRRRTVARNAAWTAWLRLPWPEACRTTLRALERLVREGHLAHDSAALLCGLAWVLPKRRIVPPHVLRLRERVGAVERAGRRPLTQTQLSVKSMREPNVVLPEQQRTARAIPSFF